MGPMPTLHPLHRPCPLSLAPVPGPCPWPLSLAPCCPLALWQRQRLHSMKLRERQTLQCSGRSNLEDWDPTHVVGLQLQRNWGGWHLTRWRCPRLKSQDPVQDPTERNCPRIRGDHCAAALRRLCPGLTSVKATGSSATSNLPCRWRTTVKVEVERSPSPG